MKEKLGLSSFTLKVIAIISMCIDHVGAVLFPQYIIFRIIGRLAFPLFAFLLVEGFMHTANVKKYALRLGAFALISEIPFDLAFNHKLVDFSHQNIFFTLFLALLFMIVATKKYRASIRILLWLLILFAAFFGGVDYSFAGVLIIVVFYYNYGYLRNQIAYFAIMNVAFFGLTVQAFACAAIVPIWLYNGKRGRQMKYFFYLFYPIHLLVIYAVFWYSNH